MEYNLWNKAILTKNSISNVGKTIKSESQPYIVCSDIVGLCIFRNRHFESSSQICLHMEFVRTIEVILSNGILASCSLVILKSPG